MKYVILTIGGLMVFLLCFQNCTSSRNEEDASTFIQQVVSRLEPLLKDQNLSHWQACVSGNDEDYDRYTARKLQVQEIYSNREDFEAIKAFQSSEAIQDPLLRRQLQRLYYSFLANQIDPELNQEIARLETELRKNFNTFRGTFKGEKVSGNDILEILQTSLDMEERREAWEAAKQVGPVVEKDLLRLVKLRNQAARELGFENYFSMQLYFAEQDEEELITLFDRLEALTDEPFEQAKEEIDRILAVRYGVEIAGMRPWHYQDPFFQESPKVFEVDLDRYYQDQEIKDLAVRFFAGLGMTVQDILDRSDLYEKDGKYPHAFCTDIDRKGDVRVMLNLKNNEAWMDTILHELGHGVYSKYQDPGMPFLLRRSAHTMWTEAIALFFGRLAHNPQWMNGMNIIDREDRVAIAPELYQAQRFAQLIFARWCQVMFRFERSLYNDPDQDLNTLWWNLVEKYQGINRPEERNEPDWATKIHFTSSPVYYHNYLLGELLASQLYYCIKETVLQETEDGLTAFVGQVGVGDYQKESIFRQGARYPWNTLIAQVTGEKLSPDFFVRQFVLPQDE